MIFSKNLVHMQPHMQAVKCTPKQDVMIYTPSVRICEPIRSLSYFWILHENIKFLKRKKMPSEACHCKRSGRANVHLFEHK